MYQLANYLRSSSSPPILPRLLMKMTVRSSRTELVREKLPFNCGWTLGTRTLLALCLLFLQSFCVSAATNLSKSVENIYMFHKDQAVLNLDEYIMGDGSAVSISSNSLNAEVDMKVLPPVQHMIKTTGCWSARMFPTDNEHMYMLCPDNTLVKAALSDNSRLENTTLRIASSEYECHEILIADNMVNLIAVCLSAMNETHPKGATISVQFIDPTTMLSDSVHYDVQVPGKNISFLNEPMNSESQVFVRLESKMLLLASAQKSKEFKVYTIESNNVVSSQQRYGLFSNILDVPFNHTIEKCGFEELVADMDYIYMTVSCDNNFRKYYCRCAPEQNSKGDGKDLRCIKKECFFREYSLNSEYTFPVKMVKRITGKNGDSIYYFNGTSLFLRDFGKSISKEVFRFNDINLVNKKSFIIKGAVLMGKLLHLVILIPATNPANSMLDMITVSVARQYYRRINLLKGDYVSSVVEFVAENPAKFSLYQVLIHCPGSGKTLLYEDNSILSMKFILERKDSALLASQRRAKRQRALQGLGNEQGGSGSEGSPLIVIPVQFSITASGKTNVVSLNLNVLVDENESAELDLPKELVFYHGSLPLALPLSKQSIKGYSPMLTVTGKDGRTHKVEYISPVSVKHTPENLIPAGKVQFYHLDNNLFLLRSKETLKVIEFKADRNSKESEFVERQQTTMSLESEFFDAISGDDMRVYILVKTSENSVSLIILKPDGSSIPVMPFQLPNAEKILMGAINIFNGAIEVDVLIQTKSKQEVELHILNAPLAEIDRKVANFKIYPFLPRNICPKWIEWASRKLPYLYVESNCEVKYTIFEIFLESVRESEVPINSFFLKSETAINMSLCAYDKNLMLIDRQKKIVEGMDRLTEFNPKIRYYPLQEYNVTDITRYHCDHANPFLGILGPDESGQFSKIVLYRVEESGDNSLRRVHSVINLKKLYSSKAVLTVHSDPDGIKGYVTVLEDSAMEQFIFNLAVPSVIIDNIGSAVEETLTFKLKVQASNNTDGYDEEIISTVNLRLINQSFASAGYLVGNQPVLKETEYSLESQFKFDGVFLRSYLEIDGKPASSEMLEKKGIVSYTDRKTKLDTDPDKVIAENCAATNIIIEKNIAFAWNKSVLTVYDTGRRVLKYESQPIVDLGYAHYPTYDNQFVYQDYIGLTVEPQVSYYTMVLRNTIGQWKVSKKPIATQAKNIRGMRSRVDYLTYAAIDSDTNVLEVGEILVNIMIQDIEASAIPGIFYLPGDYHCYDAIATEYSVVVVVKFWGEDTGVVYEISKDPLQSKMTAFRTTEISLKGPPANRGQIGTVQRMKCAGHAFRSTDEFQYNCFFLTDGMYSYANKITIRGNALDADLFPVEVTPITLWLNMQGYVTAKFDVAFNYTAVLLIEDCLYKKGVIHASKCHNPSRIADFLVAVFVAQADSATHYLVLRPTDLGIQDRIDPMLVNPNMYRSDFGERNKLIVQWTDSKGKLQVQSFLIGPMKISVKSSADDKWTGEESLVIEHVTGTNNTKSSTKFAINSLIGDLNQRWSFGRGFGHLLLIIGMLVTLMMICMALTQYVHYKKFFLAPMTPYDKFSSMKAYAKYSMADEIDKTIDTSLQN